MILVFEERQVLIFDGNHMDVSASQIFEEFLSSLETVVDRDVEIGWVCDDGVQKFRSGLIECEIQDLIHADNIF